MRIAAKNRSYHTRRHRAICEWPFNSAQVDLSKRYTRIICRQRQKQLIIVVSVESVCTVPGFEDSELLLVDACPHAQTDNIRSIKRSDVNVKLQCPRNNKKSSPILSQQDYNTRCFAFLLKCH